MIKVKMLKNAEYSLDGRTASNFNKGEVYEVPQAAFDQFYKDGSAQKINPTTEPAPENKAVKEAKEVKCVEAVSPPQSEPLIRIKGKRSKA